MSKPKAPSDDIDRLGVAIALRYLREDAGMPMAKVAGRLHIRKEGLWEFENGNEHAIGLDKIKELPLIFKCASISAMIKKAEKLPFPEIYDYEAIGLALRYLREDKGLTQAYVARRIGSNREQVRAFEDGKRSLGKDKIDKLPGVFACKSLAEMIDKANALPWEGIYCDKEVISRALKYLRPQYNLSQGEIAEEIDVHISSLSNFERGDLTQLGFEKLKLLPPLFDCKTLREMADLADTHSRGKIYRLPGYREAERRRRSLKNSSNAEIE